LHCP